ncbi:MAG: MGDG synthase family glycosyltransferase, partial [Mycobacteriales bacterium]
MTGRALVLSGPFGMGHTMMAEAAEDVLAAAGWQVRRRDSMQLLGPVAGRSGDLLFHGLLRVPGLYDAVHFAHLRTGSRLAVAMDRQARRRLVPALRAELEEHPADLVLSVFATGASAAAGLKQEQPSRRTVVLCTDVAVHRLWVHRGTDLFLVTSAAAEASVRRYCPDALVAQVPAPVRTGFAAAPSRPRARADLRIEPDAPCALLVDSGWGLGPVVTAA